MHTEITFCKQYFVFFLNCRKKIPLKIIITFPRKTKNVGYIKFVMSLINSVIFYKKQYSFHMKPGQTKVITSLQPEKQSSSPSQPAIILHGPRRVEAAISHTTAQSGFSATWRPRSCFFFVPKREEDLHRTVTQYRKSHQSPSHHVVVSGVVLLDSVDLPRR